jgi:hypothetical protein
MLLILVGIITRVLVSIIIISLFASAKGEDKLREKSCEHYHS